MRFIAIDLELEQPKTNPQTPDSAVEQERIIQVGLVVFELGTEITVLESRTIFVSYEYPLSNFIKTLTGIQDFQVNDSSNTLVDVVSSIKWLREFYNTSRQIVEWGSGDINCLRNELSLSEDEFRIATGLARSTINAKVLFQLYAVKAGLKAQGGLGKSLRKLGLEFQPTKYNGKQYGSHWAESDALNTAIIFNFIMNKFNA
jgi:inhibitor of KinA sporulation pathway (predicted exonuclease)